jgi:hypothetical protein
VIPVKLEELILAGNATFETYQIGLTEFNVIPVKEKEYIIVLGYDFQAANDVSIPNKSVENNKVIQKIEFFDGFRYNHFIHKMMDITGSSAILQDQRMVSNEGLYMIFKRDVGISITIPFWANYNWTTYVDTLDGGVARVDVPNTAKNIIFEGTNRFQTNPISSLVGTEMATPQTSSVPLNRSVNGSKYSDQYTNGPYGTGFDNNQFNFSPETDPAVYVGDQNYETVTPSDMNKGFYLNVKYVRVFQEADENIR